MPSSPDPSPDPSAESAPTDRATDFTALWVVHDAVRRDLVRIVSLIGGTGPVRQERRAGLRAHWALLVGVLDAHEAAEAELLWPTLRAVVPADAAATVDLAHGDATPSVDPLGALTDAVAAATLALEHDDALDAGPAREALTALLQRVAVLADRHFGIEERLLLPLAAQWLPKSDWDAYVTGWLDAPGPGGRAVVLPFLLESAHRDRAAGLLAVVDEVDRRAYAEEWKASHQQRVDGLW